MLTTSDAVVVIDAELMTVICTDCKVADAPDAISAPDVATDFKTLASVTNIVTDVAAPANVKMDPAVAVVYETVVATDDDVAF